MIQSRDGFKLNDKVIIKEDEPLVRRFSNIHGIITKFEEKYIRVDFIPNDKYFISSFSLPSSFLFKPHEIRLIPIKGDWDE